MTKQEIIYLKKGANLNHDPVWTKAFEEYNNDHPKDRPLEMNCRPCYWKVFFYLNKKYAKH